MRSRSRRAPRASRPNADVRVVVGLAPLTRAIAEIERLPDSARTPGIAASYDEITDMVTPDASAEAALRRVRGVVWKMEDRSDTGCRLTAPAKEAPAKLGEILALKEGDSLGACGRAPDAAASGRRDDRRHRDRRPAARARADAELGRRRRMRARAGADRPFFGIYLPAHPENRQMAQRSLIGPDERFVTGGMVELDTGNARYLIRFTQTLERQPGWAWTLFSAVRKLTP